MSKFKTRVELSHPSWRAPIPIPDRVSILDLPPETDTSEEEFIADVIPDPVLPLHLFAPDISLDLATKLYLGQQTYKDWFVLYKGLFTSLRKRNNGAPVDSDIRSEKLLNWDPIPPSGAFLFFIASIPIMFYLAIVFMFMIAKTIWRSSAVYLATGPPEHNPNAPESFWDIDWPLSFNTIDEIKKGQYGATATEALKSRPLLTHKEDNYCTSLLVAGQSLDKLNIYGCTKDMFLDEMENQRYDFKKWRSDILAREEALYKVTWAAMEERSRQLTSRSHREVERHDKPSKVEITTPDTPDRAQTDPRPAQRPMLAPRTNREKAQAGAEETTELRGNVSAGRVTRFWKQIIS